MTDGYTLTQERYRILVNKKNRTPEEDKELEQLCEALDGYQDQMNYR